MDAQMGTKLKVRILVKGRVVELAQLAQSAEIRLVRQYVVSKAVSKAKVNAQ